MDKKFADFKKKEPVSVTITKSTNYYHPSLTKEDIKNIQAMDDLYKLLDSILMEKATTT